MIIGPCPYDDCSEIASHTFPGDGKWIRYICNGCKRVVWVQCKHPSPTKLTEKAFTESGHWFDHENQEVVEGVSVKTPRAYKDYLAEAQSSFEKSEWHTKIQGIMDDATAKIIAEGKTSTHFIDFEKVKEYTSEFFKTFPTYEEWLKDNKVHLFCIPGGKTQENLETEQ